MTATLEITVKLYGALRGFRPASARGEPHHPFSIELSPGDTVATLIETLQMPQEMVHAVAVDGQQATLEAPLQNATTVHLFPPSAGG